MLRRLLLTLLPVWLAAAPALASEASPYGINIHAPGGAELERLLDRVDAAGIGWVRIDFVWAAVERSPGVDDWSHYDAIAAAAKRRGIEVFATLAYTPDWATSGPTLAGVPDDPAAWAAFCRRAASRYRGSIRTWGLWNEPNLDRFWAGSRQQYIDLILKPGADAIRAGNPDAVIAGPELAHVTSGGSDWYRWLRQSILEAGDRLDVVTHHVYDEDGHRDVREKLEERTPFGRAPAFWDGSPPSVKEVLVNTGWLGRPFWLTETGWATDRVSEAAQAERYTGLLGDWLTGVAGRDWIDKIFFYEAKDDPSPGIPRWGILRADDTPKAAYRAYRDFIAAHGGDEPAGEPLPLLGGRFLVQVDWRDQHNGGTGVGTPIRGSDESGFFWFFDEANVELVVKILDGRPVNDHFWFFYGALSDVEYTITVTDTATGAVKTYLNPPGNLCGEGDVTAFAAPAGTAAASTTAVPAVPEPLPIEIGAGLTATPAAAGACASSPGGLCLLGGRFRVEVAWRDQHNGGSGAGAAVPLTDQTGTFWFFDQDNVELVVKVLDGRPLTGKFWVFYGALSDVEYTITVTDTATGASKQYKNPPGNICGLGDTGAL